ncbi:hypothetical protein Hypma_014240 [Hypsizygus marmoreus]|uniref:Uncharacterized protein n=1 Tax=Hypsizygus marmoreus TaxID=39966 RepID=A0A369JK18_HYPMA|nr:hypothetical protein Hypma_014240 [Hypsizygus marmoreus]
MTPTPLSDERLRWIEFDAGESNSVTLSDTEARIARQLLADAERHLKMLDIQIAELCRQREHNAARLERLRVAVAPHKRLPVEILSHIFGISSGQRALEIPPPDPPQSHPPWTLRHVCSGWRHIVLSDHRIWNRISLNFEIGTRLSETDQVRKIQRSERILSTILPESGTISMSFRITGSSTRVQKAIQTFVKPYSGRIVELSIGLPGNEFPSFLGMLPNEVGVLEILELDFITSFPKLEKCSIAHCSRHSNPPSEHAILPHLHSLSVLSLVNSLFDGFTLLSLSILVVRHMDRFPAAEITSMIHRSGCVLRGLRQVNIGRGGTECDLDDLATLLAASPSLEIILVSSIVLHEPILEQIGQGRLLPNLKMLQCRLARETLDFASKYFRGGNTTDSVTGLGLYRVQDSESDHSRRGENTVAVRIWHES